MLQSAGLRHWHARCTPHLSYIFFMKADESWQLFRCWYRHVVLDRIQSSQDEVEDAHRIAQLDGQLLNDNCKAAQQHAQLREDQQR